MVRKTVSIIVIIEVIFRDQKIMDKIHGANPPTTVDAEPLWIQILPVTYRVNFKIAMLAHKCIYGNAPEYLKDLIKVKSTTRYILRSDGEMLLEDYSARSKKTLGDRTFKVAAPRIWNILPKDIRKQDNYYSVCAVT